MTISVGDRVAVTLPGGEYIGTVSEIKPDYMWTNETWYRVTGTKPRQFLTTVREVRPV